MDGSTGLVQSARVARAIEPGTDEAVANQEGVDGEQQREGCPEHHRELDEPRPVHARHRDLQGHHQREVADASYWIYIAHLPLVMALQVAMSRVDWPWAIEFALVLGTAFALLLRNPFWLACFLFWLLRGRALPPFITAWLRYIPAAVLAALLLPSLLVEGGRLNLTWDNLYLWAALPAALAAWKWKSLFGTVLVGMALVALARLLGW